MSYTKWLPIIFNYVNSTRRDKRRHLSVCPFMFGLSIIHILYIPLTARFHHFSWIIGLYLYSVYTCVIYTSVNYTNHYSCVYLFTWNWYIVLRWCIHLKSYIFEHNFKKLAYIYIIINVSKLDWWWLISWKWGDAYDFGFCS